MQLDQLPINQMACVTAIDWDAIPPGEGHRLRALGLDEGAIVETLHRGMFFWRDPIAVRIGRMTIAMRSRVASAITTKQQ